jgi:DNA-binding PadR family transcriptional regulator
MYILHLIADKPRHGYEIIQDIQAKTEGAWSPAAGSIYPLLKKLVSEGLIEAETTGDVDERRIYRITPKGSGQVVELKGAFANFGQRWAAMRNLIMGMLDPEKAEEFVLDGSKKQFEFIQEFVKSKMDVLPEGDVEYLLKEYALNLERQLGWTNQTLSGLRTKPVVPSKARKDRA